MTQRDRLMITAILLIVLLGGYWFVLLSPKREAAATAEANVATAQQALATAQQQLTSGKAAQARFRTDRATVVRLGRVVPPTDDAATVLTQLSALARKHKVSFVSYAINNTDSGGAAAAAAAAPAPDAAGEEPTSTDAVAPLYPPGSVTMAAGLGRTPLKLELTGSYFNVERYLRAVQRFAVISGDTSKPKANGRLFIVDGIDYQPSDATSGAGKLDVELFASVYFAPPIEAPATPAVDPATGAAPTTTSSSGTAAIGGLR